VEGSVSFMIISTENTTLTNAVDVKLIAFYLPQFHPIPENDEWWGKGFTEWTNVTRARPRFAGHAQPHLPADLGFYDLRLAETRQAQAELARAFGISAFCYYHYWFNGRRLLERPFNDVLSSREPDFPFCLCWANENWTRRWDGKAKEVLMAQQYDSADDLAHLRHLITAFTDQRYVRIQGKPLFIVYRVGDLPDIRATAERWRTEYFRLTKEELFLCQVVRSQQEQIDPQQHGMDASLEFQPSESLMGYPLPNNFSGRVARRMGLLDFTYGGQYAYKYPEYVQRVLQQPPAPFPTIPTVFPTWDNSARLREKARIFLNCSPSTYQHWLTESIRRAQLHPVAAGQALVFINAWNEWAEGAHLEPCQQWGRAYLTATQDALRAATRSENKL
jgi:lipopolysaccharide biosynthesis protein